MTPLSDDGPNPGPIFPTVVPTSRTQAFPPLWLLPLLVMSAIAGVVLLLAIVAGLGGGIGLGVGLAAGGWAVHRLQVTADAYLRSRDHD